MCVPAPGCCSEKQRGCEGVSMGLTPPPGQVAGCACGPCSTASLVGIHLPCSCSLCIFRIWHSSLCTSSSMWPWGREGTFRSSVSWQSVDPLPPPLYTGHWCTHGAVVPHGRVPHGHVPAHLHCVEQVAPVQLDHLAVLLLRVLKESEQAWAWGRDLGTHQAPRYPPPASPPAPGSWTAWQRCRGGSAALPWTLGEHSGPPSA